MANRRFIDFPIASTVGDNDIVLIWQDGLNKQTTKGTLIQGAPTSLEGLTDVDIAGLINGQILQYNSVTGKWENVDRTGLNLSELGDVSIVSPSNGQVLVYNSTTSKWENSSAGFVPYVGAVTTVDLGAQGLRAGYVRFNTSVVSVPDEQGIMFWDADDETIDVILNGYIMKIGEDQFYPVKNQTGSSIAKGTAVRFAGTVGASGRLLIAPFIADGSVSSSFFMGVTAEAIADGADGKVLFFGRIRGINTDAFNEGDVLYASTTVAGGFQTAVPVAPNNIVQVAAVITKSINQGVIFIRPSFGSNINQNEGVKIVSPTTGQLLQLQANGLWENKTTAQVLGGTSSQFVKGDGTLDSNTYQVTSEKGQPNGYASLDSNGKVPLVQINDALIGNVNFQGLWNASTNTPTLANPPASGTKGHYYIVSTAGTFAGISFEVGDWIISDGTAWGKVDNTDAVSSVFGRTGNVTAANGDYTTAQVTESGNLYYTDGRARGAISLTTTGASGSSTYNNTTGVLNVPAYTLSGLGGIGGTIAAGQVAFGTAANTIGGDSGLVWDNTNKRLGVGISPSFQLEVFGSVSEKARFRDSDSIYNGVVIMADINAGWIGNNTTLSSEGFYLQNSISAIRTIVGGLERTRLTTSSFGIFTASPTRTLDVNGTGRIRNGVSLADTSGNVQIGTLTDAGFRLDVNGTARVQGALSIIGNIDVLAGGVGSSFNRQISLGSGTAYNYQVRANDDDFQLREAGSHVFLAYTYGGSLGTGTIRLYNNTVSNSSITGTSFIPSGSGIPTNGMYLPSSNILAFATASTERIRINSNGRVAINDTATEGLFNINTKSSTTYNASSYNGSGTNIYLTNGSGGSGRFSGINFAGGGSTEGFFGVVQNGSSLAEFVFQTYNGSAYGERMRITSGGNVLIGTDTNGSSKLRLVGLPTSAAGLSSGDVYNLAGALMIA
jgi:hypothetical protein